MKTTFLILGFATSLTLVSCKKNESKMSSEAYSTETTVVDDNGKIDSATTTSAETDVDGSQSKSYSFPYKATDGSRAKATFTQENHSKTILIEANHNKFQLDFKNKTAKGELYERNGISAETKGDSLIIKQDQNEIPLVKVK